MVKVDNLDIICDLNSFVVSVEAFDFRRVHDDGRETINVVRQGKIVFGVGGGDHDAGHDDGFVGEHLTNGPFDVLVAKRLIVVRRIWVRFEFMNDADVDVIIVNQLAIKLQYLGNALTRMNSMVDGHGRLTRQDVVLETGSNDGRNACGSNQTVAHHTGAEKVVDHRPEKPQIAVHDVERESGIGGKRFNQNHFRSFAEHAGQCVSIESKKGRI